MNRDAFEDGLQELSSAEDFLDHFGVAYDPHVVRVNRLHILQRFHDYLAAARAKMPDDGPALREAYRRHLARAYQDFVESDALTERVFQVFRTVRGGQFVPVDAIGPAPSPPEKEA